MLTGIGRTIINHFAAFYAGPTGITATGKPSVWIYMKVAVPTGVAVIIFVGLGTIKSIVATITDTVPCIGCIERTGTMLACIVSAMMTRVARRCGDGCRHGGSRCGGKAF